METRAPKPATALCVLQACPAELLCSAAHQALFQRNISSDILLQVGLMCLDNREGRAKSAFLRGQSLGRMRSRRGYSQPPEHRKADRTRSIARPCALHFF